MWPSDLYVGQTSQPTRITTVAACDAHYFWIPWVKQELKHSNQDQSKLQTNTFKPAASRFYQLGMNKSQWLVAVYD